MNSEAYRRLFNLLGNALRERLGDEAYKELERLDRWERIEPGWYRHSVLGGIIKESDGWYIYPMYYDSDVGIGPYPTLKKAKQRANAICSR